MSAWSSCRALGVKDSTSVQSRPREQTSETAGDGAELSWGTVGVRGAAEKHGMGDGGEPCDLEPSGATKHPATGLTLRRLIHSPRASMFAACPAQSQGKVRAWLGS